MCYLFNDYTKQTAIGAHDIALLSTNQSTSKHLSVKAINSLVPGRFELNFR